MSPRDSDANIPPKHITAKVPRDIFMLIRNCPEVSGVIPDFPRWSDINIITTPIIPVRDRGAKHVVGIMGGTAVQGNWDEAFVYFTSIEYFNQACSEAKCDVGLGTHASRDYKADFDKLATLKRGEPNLLVIGTEKFDTVYLQKYGKTWTK